MPQGLQELDLAHGRDREAVALGFHADLLEGNDNTGAGVPRFPYLPEGAFTDLIEAVVDTVSNGRRGPRNATRRHWLMIALGCRRIHSIFASVRRPAGRR